MFALPIVGNYQQWPNGSMGDRTISGAEYVIWNASSKDLDYRDLTVPLGSALYFLVEDGSPVTLGVARTLTLNGSIAVFDRNTKTSWPYSSPVYRTDRTGKVWTWTMQYARLYLTE